MHADAYESYPTGIVLNVEPVTWLEVRDHEPRRVVSGYMHPTLAGAPLDSTHPDKARLKRAAGIVRKLHSYPALSLALGDFYTARRDPGPYSAFYAFRVLEDVGFHFGTTDQGKPDWAAMNQRLGTTEAQWKVLTNAGTTARHLSSQGLSTLGRADPGRLLDLARDALARAMATL